MGFLVDVVLGTVVIAVPSTRLPLLAVGIGTQVFKVLGVFLTLNFVWHQFSRLILGPPVRTTL